MIFYYIKEIKLKYLKILPLITLLLSANDTEIKTNNIVISEHTNPTCKIAFKELLQEGLVSHPSMSLSKEIIAGAENEVDSAFWGYFPTPSVEVSAADADRKQTVLRLDQPIWTGGKLDSAYDKAQAKKEEATQSYSEYRYKLIENYLNTLQKYVDSSEKIVVLKENKKDFRDLNEMLDRMIKAGVASNADKNLLKSRTSSIDSNIVITKSKLNIAKIQFQILSGRKIDCNIGYDYVKDNQFQNRLKIEDLIDELTRSNPGLKKADAQIKTAISEVAKAKSNVWPDLILRGEHRTGTLYTEIQEPADRNLVYLTFSASPGPGLSGMSNIQVAQLKVSQVKYEKEVKKRELIDNLMNDYTNYISAKNNLKVIKQNIAVLESIYKSNQRLYMSQEKKWLDLVNSLSELNKEKIEYSRLNIEKKVLEYKILLKTGKINLEDGEVLSDI